MSKKINQLFLTFFIAILFHFQASGKHIIGGIITYKCLGAGKYEFTMKVFRDCAGGGADFDEYPIVSFYKGNAAPYKFIKTFNEVKNKNTPSEDQNKDFTSQQITSIAAPDYPCLELPPNLCVEEAVYVWTHTFTDWPSTESYHIVYQRCCRNNTITNIVSPDKAGATYSVEITPESQAVSNNSPTFSLFPPIVICNNQPLVYDHSATDDDGDVLKYSFCAPLLGGGNNFGNSTYTCNGVKPDPGCPPPFNKVQFVAPTYNALKPMAGNPIIKIDNSTGLITGTPEAKGQYVVGVCVEEFRNGKSLGKIFRDFQFNVASCIPDLVADIKEDKILGEKSYLVNSCGNKTVEFINQSTKASKIQNYLWSFNLQGKSVQVTTKNAMITFPDYGQYKGVLYLNKGSACADSAEIYVNIFPEIKADFKFAYDTCVATPVYFTDLSYSGAGQISKWAWNFGDGGSSDVPSTFHQYLKPGKIPVMLTVQDPNGCVGTVTKDLNWFPVPPLLVIEPSAKTGCVPLAVTFKNLSVPIDATYDAQWTFGDGTFGTGISPTHVYETTGTFSCYLKLTSPIGCKTERGFPEIVSVTPSPVANFYFTPDDPTSEFPEVTFIDQSLGAKKWSWSLGNTYTSSKQNPTYTFPDTGYQVIRLIVTHESGCRDTLTKTLDVKPIVRFFMPNAFSPNYDTKNDVFKGTGELLGVRNFQFSIWNRWGERVFETNNPNEGWNGLKFNTGTMSPDGVYVYFVSFTGARGEPFEFRGFATLLK